MKIRIDRTRMAMRGEYYAYDVTVPAEEVPWMNPCDVTTILKDGVSPRNEHYNFCDVMIGPEHYQMDKGWDRDQDHLDTEKACRPIMLELAQRVFPELAKVTQWRELWHELPGFDERHATRYIDEPMTQMDALRDGHRTEVTK